MSFKERVEEIERNILELKNSKLIFIELQECSKLRLEIEENGCKETEEICWQSQGEDMSSMFYCCGKHIREWGIEEGLCSKCKALMERLFAVSLKSVQQEDKK